jgi:hypothetical protein
MRWTIGVLKIAMEKIRIHPQYIAYNPAKIFSLSIETIPTGPLPSMSIAALRNASIGSVSLTKNYNKA